MQPAAATVHVFTTPIQSALRVVDSGCYGEPIIVRNKPRALGRCYGCRKKRRCENLGVQVFYDSIRYWCVAGKGCKK